MESPIDSTSSNLEKVALSLLRKRSANLSPKLRIFREPWGMYTVVCLDFAQCPDLFPLSKKQKDLLSNTIQELGLASSIIFRMGNKVLGWQRI